METTRSFRRHERLKEGLRFKDIKSNPARFAKGLFIIAGASPNGLNYNRIGISISAKRIAGSVERNRLKRLIREAYRINKHALKRGFDIVVRPKFNARRDLAFEQIEKDLRLVLKKINIHA